MDTTTENHPCPSGHSLIVSEGYYVCQNCTYKTPCFGALTGEEFTFTPGKELFVQGSNNISSRIRHRHDRSQKKKRNPVEQQEFKHRLKLRHQKFQYNEYMCEICCDKLLGLEAAHVFDYASQNLLEQYYMTTENFPCYIYDVRNGLLLCKQCHSYFDHEDKLMLIEDDGTISLYGELSEISYKDLHGKKVPWHEHINKLYSDWPSMELLRVVREKSRISNRNKISWRNSQSAKKTPSRVNTNNETARSEEKDDYSANENLLANIPPSPSKSSASTVSGPSTQTAQQQSMKLPGPGNQHARSTMTSRPSSTAATLLYSMQPRKTRFHPPSTSNHISDDSSLSGSDNESNYTMSTFETQSTSHYHRNGDVSADEYSTWDEASVDGNADEAIGFSAHEINNTNSKPKPIELLTDKTESSDVRQNLFSFNMENKQDVDERPMKRMNYGSADAAPFSVHMLDTPTPFSFSIGANNQNPFSAKSDKNVVSAFGVASNCEFQLPKLNQVFQFGEQTVASQSKLEALGASGNPFTIVEAKPLISVANTTTTTSKVILQAMAPQGNPVTNETTIVTPSILPSSTPQSITAVNSSVTKTSSLSSMVIKIEEIPVVYQDMINKRIDTFAKKLPATLKDRPSEVISNHTKALRELLNEGTILILQTVLYDQHNSNMQPNPEDVQNKIKQMIDRRTNSYIQKINKELLQVAQIDSNNTKKSTQNQSSCDNKENQNTHNNQQASANNQQILVSKETKPCNTNVTTHCRTREEDKERETFRRDNEYERDGQSRGNKRKGDYCRENYYNDHHHGYRRDYYNDQNDRYYDNDNYSYRSYNSNGGDSNRRYVRARRRSDSYSDSNYNRNYDRNREGIDYGY